MYFASAWKHLLKNLISLDFLLIEGYGQSALRKELRIVPFVERFEITTLRRSR